jgi:two-component system phosphate regulon sensor histidine kinase PhoR
MLPRRSIWIVDDSLLEGERARACLAAEHHVELFTDGSVMLERLADEVPDLLVLDWLMPEVSGIEVCQFIRSREAATAHVAVLMLTVQNETEQVVRALDAGANDFLTKPYADEELRARVAALLRTRELVERVERAEANVRTLLSNTPDALLAVGLDGKIMFVNREAEKVLGAPSGELIGRPLSELLPELPLDSLRLGGREALLPMPDVNIGDEIYSPTVRALPTDFAASRTIALHNVTEHRRNEARRLDFYSIIAHDLRSPLSARLLRTATILSGRRGLMAPQLTDDIRKIDGNLRSMVALINDFLDLARLEGAGYRVDRESVELTALVRNIADDVRPLAEESQLQLDVELPATTVEITGDRRRLAQVITNLLSNAIKFTPAGGRVTVRGGVEPEAAYVQVEDTGRGIPAEALPTLFQRYTRAIDPQHHVPGTGLGLMIVKEIIDAHGGTVSVRSQPQRGSSFLVRLPRAAVEAAPATDLVVIDDDVDVRESLLFLLEAEGYHVQLAASGETALELMSEDRPCAVLLDLMMPTMSGWDVLEHMRTDPRLKSTPVGLMSASVDKGMRLPGVTVLPKPIEVEALLAFVKQHCRGRSAPRTTSSGST